MRVKTGAINLADYGQPPVWADVKDASLQSVKAVLHADRDGEDGRSQWVWIRFPNGDLVLAVYPQGDTYFETELDHSS